ncbi:hypothetical protein TNCV_1023531 [Trichonephila clavipes]|nr:hypothetical protein TNCV_1023531 [Trichonephila clavipes]
MPVGWCGWFVTGLLPLKLPVQPRPKSVDFPDAENRQRSCRMIIQHLRPLYRDSTGAFEKYNLEVGLSSGVTENFSAHLQSQPFVEKVQVRISVRRPSDDSLVLTTSDTGGISHNNNNNLQH